MRKSVENLRSLKLRSFAAEFWAESAALWFLCLYILMEYIRPYDMYSFLDVLPWGKVTILACVASVFITGNKANGFGAMDKMFTVFSVLVVLSGFFAWSPVESLKYWTTYTSWVLMYFCVVSILTTPNRILLFTLFFLIINFKLSQHGARSFAMRGFSFAVYGLTGPPGWFRNSGEYALQMVVMFSLSLSLLITCREYIRTLRWWLLMFLLPGTAAITIIGSSSRGGQIALVAVVLVFLLKGGNILKKALVIITLLYVGLHLLPESQVLRFDTMGDDRTSELRLEHWRNAIDVIKNKPWGIGYKNWIPYYAENYNPDVVQEIHNTVLQAFVELGYLGGMIFLIMIISSFMLNIKTSNEMMEIGGVEEKLMAAIAVGINLGLLGAFIAALFMSVLYYPIFWLAFSMTSALRHISKNKIKMLHELSVPIEKSRQGTINSLRAKKLWPASICAKQGNCCGK